MKIEAAYNLLAEQSRAEQSRAEQSRAEQSRAEQGGNKPLFSVYRFVRKREQTRGKYFEGRKTDRTHLSVGAVIFTFCVKLKEEARRG